MHNNITPPSRHAGILLDTGAHSGFITSSEGRILADVSHMMCHWVQGPQKQFPLGRGAKRVGSGPDLMFACTSLLHRFGLLL